MVIYYTNTFGNNKGESHRLLEKAITMHTGKDGKALVQSMTFGEYGKPSIEGIDHFSISHSENMWGVLFDTYPCGLDVQHHRKNDCFKIAERWYHPDETAYLRSLPEDEIVQGFYKIWTRREALVKSVGESIITSKLPSTLEDSVQYNGQTWKFQDFTMTGADNMSISFCIKEVDSMDIIWLGGANA